MKKINKKGEGDSGLVLQQIMFYAAELAVGAFIIILSLQLIFAAVRNAEAQQISRDFASTLQTMSAYPHTTYFYYTTNLSKGAMTISEDEVRVDISKGSYTAPIKLSKGIQIDPKNFYESTHIPIISRNNKILFSGKDVKEIICEKLYLLPRGTNFLIEYESKQEEQTKINSLKQGIQLIHSIEKNSNPELKLDITERPKENVQKIKISFQDVGSTTIIYNNAKKEHEMFACYMRQDLSEKKFSEISSYNTQFKETEIIEIKLPSNEHLNIYLTNETYQQHREETNTQTETDLMHLYSKTIYDTLSKIVNDK